MTHRKAAPADIPAVLALHSRFHSDTIAPEDRKDGFVTTPFTEELLAVLIEKEGGLFLTEDGTRLAGYAMAASWEFCSRWPLFRHMIAHLGDCSYQNTRLTTQNSYQYGPVCLDKPYRGQGVFPELFRFALAAMAETYPYMVTFVNKANPRSLKAHEKLGLHRLKEFSYHGREYVELVCPARD